MTLRIGETAPDFTAVTTVGTIHFHDWIGDSWCMLFSHPKDFTPVCTTELGEMAGMMAEFEARGCKVIGLSPDAIEDHIVWTGDIEAVSGHVVTYPIIADSGLDVAKAFGMLSQSEVTSGPRTVAQNATVRSVFVLDPQKTIRLAMAYPFTCGRNFNEVLRALDSLQLTDAANVATPANWTNGDEVLILPSVTDAVARSAFPQGWRSPKPYMRFTTLSR
ncbi:MAG: peroxiredoxin [Pseudomonadota bacterium]